MSWLCFELNTRSKNHYESEYHCVSLCFEIQLHEYNIPKDYQLTIVQLTEWEECHRLIDWKIVSLYLYFDLFRIKQETKKKVLNKGGTINQFSELNLWEPQRQLCYLHNYLHNFKKDGTNKPSLRLSAKGICWVIINTCKSIKYGVVTNRQIQIDHAQKLPRTSLRQLKNEDIREIERIDGGHPTASRYYSRALM